MHLNNVVKIYIQLLGEGSAAARGTQAKRLGKEFYEVLPIPNYNPQDEIWEFPPGSIVRGEKVKNANGEEILLAVKASN